MERLDAGDVLAIFRARVDELERQGDLMREARDELLSEVARLTRERRHWQERCWKVERSRKTWREKAKERRRKVHALQWKLAWSDPEHPYHDSRVAA